MENLFFRTVVVLIGCLLSPFWLSNFAKANEAANAIQRAERFLVSQGNAKVYLIGGKSGFGSPFDPTIPGAELIINNITVVKFGKNEVGVVDLPPGSYVFSWKDINNEGKPETLTKHLGAGEILILRADFKMGGGGLLFGPIGASATNKIIEISDRSAIDGKRLVLANNCPESICGTRPDLTPAEKPKDPESVIKKPESVITQSSKSTNSTPNQPISSPNIEALETKCRQLGFTPGSEKFGDCVMRLLR